MMNAIKKYETKFSSFFEYVGRKVWGYLELERDNLLEDSGYIVTSNL